MGWLLVASAASGVAVWLAWAPPPLGRLGPTGERWDRRRLVEALRGLRERLPAGRSARVRTAAVLASVPGVCELLAVCLEAGRPTRSALRVVTDVVTGAPHEALTGVLRQIDLGIDDKRIQVEGYGDQYPVDVNATERGRAQNRRVEIVFSDEKGQLGAAR